MSQSDFPLEPLENPAVPAIRPDPPRIVNLPTSFDIAAEFYSEAAPAPLGEALDAFEAEMPTPVETPGEPPAAAGLPQPPALAASVEPPAVPVPPPAPGSSSVLEFPHHHPPAPPVTAMAAAQALARSTAPATAVALVDIIEQQGGLNWREAVTIVQRLCRRLKQQGVAGPILLDPRNIQITSAGDVVLLPSPSGGDPLVMQVGRLLRTMLMGRPAPPELRLLLSQATFELPIFESIDDVDRALLQLERAHEREEPRPAPSGVVMEAVYARKTHDVTPPPRHIAPDAHALGSRSIRPAKAPWRSGRPKLPVILTAISTHWRRVAVSAVVAAALIAVLVNPALLLGPLRPNPAPSTSIVGGRGDSLPPPASASPADQPSAIVGSPLAVEATSPRLPSPPRAPLVGNRAGSTPTRAGSDRRREDAPTAPAAAVPTVGVVAPRESERRATALIAQGNATEAMAVFDSLLLGNPLYEPKAGDLTPESLAAFRASQRVLLPVLAQRGYDRARSALAAGDSDRALSSAQESAAILDRTNGDAALRRQVQQVIDDATATLAAADQIVYTVKDTSVTPPRPLSRQFPATTPSGVPAHRVGTLEMVIAKNGTVEFVKLHTPLNRYHERMIVSAAKAWQYRPATRGGRPVKYRLTVTINLPENGTY